MSTTSQRMELKIPDGSDPFLRTDFVQNYNTLDKYPGNWICTSSTRPTWGSGQAGMCITETDTRRTLTWTGTTWREMLYGPAVWWGHMRPEAYIPPNTTVSYTIGTFTVNRPGSLFAILTTECAFPNRGFAGTNFRTTIDGAESHFEAGTGGFSEYAGTEFPNTSTFGDGYWHSTTASMGIRNVSAGTHSVGLKLVTRSIGTTSFRLTSTRAACFFVNATDR